MRLRVLLVVWIACLTTSSVPAEERLDFPGYALSIRADDAGGPAIALDVHGNPLITSMRPRCFAPKDREGNCEELPIAVEARPVLSRADGARISYGGTAGGNVSGSEYALRFAADIRCRTEGVVDVEYRFRSVGRDAHADCGVFLHFDRRWMQGQQARAVARGGQTEERAMDLTAPHGIRLNYYGHEIDSCSVTTPLEGPPLVVDFAPAMTLQARGQAFQWEIWNFNQKYWEHSWGKPRVWRRFAADADYPVRFRLTLPLNGAAEASAASPLSGEDQKRANPFAPDPEALRNDPARRQKDPPWLKEVAERSQELASLQSEVKTDPWTRPTVAEGTFRLGGRPQYLVGPWLGHNFSVDARFDTSAFARGDKLVEELYRRPMNRQLAEGIGFSTGHPSVGMVYWLQQFGRQGRLPAGQTYQERIDCMAYLFEGMRGLPMAPEFIPGPLSQLAATRFPGEPLLHENPGWKEFVPLNFAHPGARQLYREMFQTGARAALAAGGNTFLYELFNEPVYDSLDPVTRRAFAAWAKEAYGDIAKANERWGTRFESFEAATGSKDFRDSPALWVDWLKHNSRQWREGLRDFIAAIREVDRRPGVGFAVQAAVGFTYLTLRKGNNAIDLWEQAQVTDVITVEGGYAFGGDPPKVGGDREEMLAHLNAGALSLPYFLDVSRALAEDRKPITNHELSITRYAMGERVPTRRADFPTALWSELAHGCSMDILYSWDRRGWEWSDMAGAYEMVRVPSYKSSCLLNPYAYPPDSLLGIRDFRDEVAELADLVMPMPRTRNSTAILFSSPSLRMDSFRSANFGTAMQEAHAALIFAHHPPDFIFEEQLADASRRSRYAALVLPCATHVFAGTVPHLKNYVNAGGTLVAFAGSLWRDEHDRPLDGAAEICGLSAQDTPVLSPVRLAALNRTRLPLKQIEADRYETLRRTSASAWWSDDGGDAFVAKRTLGEGRVYYIAGRASGAHLSALLDAVLADAGIRRTVDVTTEDGAHAPNVEVQCIDRGDRKLVFLLNWSGYEARRGRVRVAAEGPWAVRDPVEKVSCPDGLDGVFLLKPQERRLLLLTRKP